MLKSHILDLLIEHIDGPVRLVRKSTGLEDGMCAARDRHLRIRQIVQAARDGLIKLHPVVSPTHSMLTDLGRAKMCAALAAMADTLVRAGLEIQDRGILSDFAENPQKGKIAPA